MNKIKQTLSKYITPKRGLALLVTSGILATGIHLKDEIYNFFFERGKIQSVRATILDELGMGDYDQQIALELRVSQEGEYWRGIMQERPVTKNEALGHYMKNFDWNALNLKTRARIHDNVYEILEGEGIIELRDKDGWLHFGLEGKTYPDMVTNEAYEERMGTKIFLTDVIETQAMARKIAL